LASFFDEHPAIKITARMTDNPPKKNSRHTLFMIGISPKEAYRKIRQDSAALRLAEVTGVLIERQW
jgi:hypothetical protein